MNARAHQTGTRLSELPANLPERRDRLPCVPRDLRPGFHHRLEQLAVDISFIGIGIANDLSAPVSQLVVGPNQQQLLLDAEPECRLAAEVALPEVCGRGPESHVETPFPARMASKPCDVHGLVALRPPNRG